MRVALPGLETVGWFNGSTAEGDSVAERAHTSDEPEAATFGGTGPLSWMREWTTGHPKVDHVTDELVLFHCNFAPPYVHYSLLPAKPNSSAAITDIEQGPILNAPVPGCSGGKLMHDFGVSRHHTVILDLPLTLTPFNLAKNKPIVSYEPEKLARFGVFPRRRPELVRWFETSGCCIFHTANTWDEYDSTGAIAVNLLACRLTSASMVFSAANIKPPPHPSRKPQRNPMSFFAKPDVQHEQIWDPEKGVPNETSPLLGQQESSTGPKVLMSYDEEEQCRLYYYRFSLDPSTPNIITHQFALSAIPFEFPTLSPNVEMDHARYIYGCSTSVESFGAALGKATKIDVLVKMDAKSLLAQAQQVPPNAITGCVDNRTMDQILASKDTSDPIKVFKLPPRHFAQEARFVPRQKADGVTAFDSSEDDGFLLFYVFDESQLDESGVCRADAKSELWVLDAQTMQRVICKIHLPTRIPYGLHGNWFTENQIKDQRGVASLRSADDLPENKWSRLRNGISGRLG